MRWPTSEDETARPGQDAPQRGTLTVDEPDLAIDERTLRDDEAPGDGTWWAVRTDPWPCPNPECAVVMPYITAMHHVIVVADRDRLLDASALAKEKGRHPKIVRYEDTFPIMTLDQWIARGRPVHGMAA